MKFIYNNILPPRGFKAINLFGLVFVRKGNSMSAIDKNHEQIHTRQMLELFIIPFYLFYFTEWLVKLIYYRNQQKAYRSLSFEREAYLFQKNLSYLRFRRSYTWRYFLRLKVSLR